VWTQDLVAGEKLLKALEAGTVFINRCDYPNPVSDPYIRPVAMSLIISTGPGMDRLEELGNGTYPWSSWL
jgi:acyl-CoA reductase-like NAD-dependent aldehyde dehydrogenase